MRRALVRLASSALSLVTFAAFLSTALAETDPPTADDLAIVVLAPQPHSRWTYDGAWRADPWVHVVPGHVPAILWASPLIEVLALPPVVYVSRVVQLPQGRYELRGHGTAAQPFTWVWVPAPLPPPTAP